MKRSLQEIWAVDERHKKFKTFTLGQYTVIENHDEGIIISGGHEINLFQLPIGKVSIGFFDIDGIEDKMERSEGSEVTTIFDVYEFEKGRIYYTVSFNKYQWVFEEYIEAMYMAKIIYDVKLNGLKEHLGLNEGVCNSAD